MTYTPETSQERVVVVEYDPGAPARFECEKPLILGILGADALAIEHIGSSSVLGLGMNV